MRVEDQKYRQPTNFDGPGSLSDEGMPDLDDPLAVLLSRVYDIGCELKREEDRRVAK